MNPGYLPQKRGIGLYSYDRIKNTMPIGRIGAILIGGIYGLCGLAYLADIIDTRKAEVHAFGFAEPHFLGLSFSILLMVFGLFVAHVGIIYYWRKIRSWGSHKIDS